MGRVHNRQKHIPTAQQWRDVSHSISIAAAARLWHYQRDTIMYHIERGHLAATQDDGGYWHVSVRSLVALWGVPSDLPEPDPWLFENPVSDGYKTVP
jgi:hypothetical protein